MPAKRKKDNKHTAARSARFGNGSVRSLRSLTRFLSSRPPWGQSSFFVFGFWLPIGLPLRASGREKSGTKTKLRTWKNTRLGLRPRLLLTSLRSVSSGLVRSEVRPKRGLSGFLSAKGFFYDSLFWPRSFCAQFAHCTHPSSPFLFLSAFRPLSFLFLFVLLVLVAFLVGWAPSLCSGAL